MLIFWHCVHDVETRFESRIIDNCVFTQTLIQLKVKCVISAPLPAQHRIDPSQRPTVDKPWRSHVTHTNIQTHKNMSWSKEDNDNMLTDMTEEVTLGMK